jgi:hypothetical protein
MESESSASSLPAPRKVTARWPMPRRRRIAKARLWCWRDEAWQVSAEVADFPAKALFATEFHVQSEYWQFR